MDRTETLNKLYDISDGIQKIVDCQTRQVSLVNEMREAKLEQVEEYDDSNISHNFLRFVFFAITLGVVYELITGILFRGLNLLLSDIVIMGICFAIISYLLYKSMHTKNNKRLLLVSIIFVFIFMYWPISFLLSGNSLAPIFIIISAIIAWFVSKKYLNFWVKLVNGEIRNQNASSKQAYDEAVSHNNQLQQLYNQESSSINQYVSEVTTIGQGWYPKDYYTLHAVKYFIHCLENYKADTVKEMVQLYDTYIDRQQRHAYEQEMVSLQEEQIINQERMVDLLEYANALRRTQIAISSEIARSNSQIVQSNAQIARSNSQIASSLEDIAKS
ncbi:MAG: hypothetical protein SPF57_04450 [Streptococcus orisratti]|uniref:hypothetical protein n=1 Tax=Bacilli TaxID=91061 RepID=UPI002A8330A4|nr:MULTISPECIES: hypothetical protein [Bacilli]MDY4023305.1 hypothetical protein [Staphylococcus borealis]MDY5635579.1 hypothetical protein [Streptococcus orisratti]